MNLFGSASPLFYEISMTYDAIIGLEIHTALKTKSKMFCACDNALNTEANTAVCPICLGHPGTLPQANEQAIDWTIMLGLALGSTINTHSKFDRKNYFYPDLPKGYQISQYDIPLCLKGSLAANGHTIQITRVHLEEDTGKLSHPAGKDYSLVDFNRAGTPLVEMVTEPVIPDAATAKAFCQRFQQILRYLGISEADMEKGEMRCEANVSVQLPGTWKYTKGEIIPLKGAVLNSKVEVKNINSFKSLEKAIDFEIARQSALIEQGEHIVQETRGWNDTTNETVRQRVKEAAADYRYFPEPDIPPIVISAAKLKLLKADLVELPAQKEKRFQDEYSISEYDAQTLCLDKALAGYFEQVISELAAGLEAEGDSWERHDKTLPKLAANWLTNEFSKHLKLHNLQADTTPVTPENFAELVLLINKAAINSSAAQQILEAMFVQGGEAKAIMRNLGLEQIDDEKELLKAVQDVLAELQKSNSSLFDEYYAGKTTLVQFFVGKVMAKTKGRANPSKVLEIINSELERNKN